MEDDASANLGGLSMATSIAVNAFVAEPMKNGVFGVAGLFRSFLARSASVSRAGRAVSYTPSNEFAPDAEPAWRRLCANHGTLPRQP